MLSRDTLNDYESMLATSTCNVGMELRLRVDTTTDDAAVEATLRQAWKQCIAEREFLQVRLVARRNFGRLRYGMVQVERPDPSLFCVVEQTEPVLPNLVRQLQQLGTTALDISKGTYHVYCIVQKQGGKDPVVVQIVISLCHAVSDGPGALFVARSFLQHLAGHASSKQEKMQLLVDLQAKLLGSDHGRDKPEQAVFDGLDDYAKSFGGDKDITPLPPEAIQGIPQDSGFGIDPNRIDCIHVALTAAETTALRTACRNRGTTVQGALVAAALKARIKLLSTPKATSLAAVQIPVNTRRMVDDNDNKYKDHCLCGSAGVWHTVPLPHNDQDWWQVAKHSTACLQTALQDNRHIGEWLRRLLHSPATLPPFSIMVSSIGVAPIQVKYGTNVTVDKLLFFGGALTNPDKPSQQVASMIHAITFDDKLQVLQNFTSPGISKKFAESLAKAIQVALRDFGT